MPTPSKNQSHEGERLDKMDAEIMDWFYECIKISFGVDMVQDSTGLREILKDNLDSLQKDYEAKVMEKIKGKGKELKSEMLKKLKICAKNDPSIASSYANELSGYNCGIDNLLDYLTDLQTELKEKDND